jgi:pyruvate/2-oxoglutarate dehydrogenase complex dihydrolipoamide dehydrogenase (E3) component
VRSHAEHGNEKQKSARLGGDCLHCGCVPSKTLIRTAGVCSLIKRSKEFSLPEAHLPPVDLGAVMDRVKSVIEQIQQHDSPERFCSLGAKVLFGNPSFSDDHQVRVDGKNISAKSWINATGSSPALPVFPMIYLKIIGKQIILLQKFNSMGADRRPFPASVHQVIQIT